MSDFVLQVQGGAFTQVSGNLEDPIKFHLDSSPRIFFEF
jgi:hypothetical protein